MKPLTYAISVRWGEGFHHFRTFREDRAEAFTLAGTIQQTLEKQWKRRPAKLRGAKPTVHVWEMAHTFEIKHTEEKVG